MWVRDEIVGVLGGASQEVKEVGALFRALDERFAYPGPRAIWERLKTRASVQDPGGWRRISALVTGPVILLVHDSQGQCGFRFDSPLELQQLIDETSRFELYVTNDELSFLVVFNHHDFLIGAGAAEPAVRALMDEP